MSRRQPGLGGYLPVALTVAALIVLVRLLLALLPLLLVAVVVVACRRWKLHRRAWAALTQNRAAKPVRAVHGQVVNSVSLDRAELARLRDDNAKLRTKVRVLSDMLTGGDS